MFRLISVILSAFGTLLAYPEFDARGNSSENFIGLQGKVHLKLSKMSYLPGEEIWADVTIRNYGNEVIRFYPAMPEIKTFQFAVTDENDSSLPLKDRHLMEDKVLKRRNTTVNLVGDSVKEIIIHKGESFTRRINLSEYFEFNPGKSYYVTGYFYPNSVEDGNHFLRTENKGIFFLENRRKEHRHKKYETESVKDSDVTPEEIVHLFLSAEMKKNWTNYFKYIHFDQFINSYPNFSKEYAEADASGKEEITEEFKRFLKEEKAGKLSYYKVTEKNFVSPSLVKVHVNAEREMGRSPAKYEYIYTLRKADEGYSRIWKITNVIVKVRR